MRYTSISTSVSIPIVPVGCAGTVDELRQEIVQIKAQLAAVGGGEGEGEVWEQIQALVRKCEACDRRIVAFVPALERKGGK
jgi:hypothetical protein